MSIKLIHLTLFYNILTLLATLPKCLSERLKVNYSNFLVSFSDWTRFCQVRLSFLSLKSTPVSGLIIKEPDIPPLWYNKDKFPLHLKHPFLNLKSQNA